MHTHKKLSIHCGKIRFGLVELVPLPEAKSLIAAGGSVSCLIDLTGSKEQQETTISGAVPNANARSIG